MQQEKTTKEKLLDSFDKEFPYVISGKIMDNENGAILFHEKTNLIKLFLSQAIDKTREEIIMAIPEEMKHDPETDSEESKTWIAGFNNCRNQILNKLKK